ncbi:MobA/MobL family protein [Microvirga calopogonii]|uniref:MobA/MobL family protein n=1 Tax=Microvirga calopogonii TaxID=2078013 RepID=UPI000E0DB9A9|nr:MobA/MobL family protein [Microvirga calopogonii]
MTEQEAEEIVRRDMARGLAISNRIAEAERRAQERLRSRSTSPRNFKALLDAMHSPGLRSARDFNRSMAFKTAPRPQAPDTGGVTFHFSVTSVSKTNRTVAAYAGRAPSGSAEQHESYIERDGAAETFIDPESNRFDQEQAAGGQDYIERPGVSEKLHEDDGIVISSFGNIADTKEERLDFWKKLEAIEQSPRGHKFTINPFRGSDFWDAVKKHRDAGSEVPAPLLRAMKHCQSDVTPLDVTLKDEAAIELLKFARTIGDFQTDGAIKVSLGRGGRVQTRIIAELPHEITPAQRLKLAKEYCAEFDRLGLPYWAVIHAPDKHNDRRNFHIHIALSERPAGRMVNPTTGKEVWDFEIVETYRSKCRHQYTHYPYAQERLRDLSTRRWIGDERRRFCNVLNKILEQSGSSKRYDHRSYKAMGLTQKAKKRIDPKIYAKERKGQVTEQGTEAARQQWKAAAHELDQQSVRAATRAVSKSYKNRTYFTAIHSAGHVDSERFLRLTRKAADLYNQLMSAMVAETAANFVADKMVSRARLKKPAQRTKIDRILIEVASEIRATEGKQFGAIAKRVGAEYREKASAIAHIRSDFARTFHKNLFDQLLNLMAPKSPSPGEPAPRGMSIDEITAMTASWFPKRTSLSDVQTKPAQQAAKESAIDRYLGKDFFNPKNAGKMPERGPKQASPSKSAQPMHPVTQSKAPTAAPQKITEPSPASVAPRSAPQKQAATASPPSPAPTPSRPKSDELERSLTIQADQSLAAKPPAVPVVEPPPTPTAAVATPTPAVAEPAAKKRKLRKTSAKPAPEQPPALTDAETRRRAILAQRRRSRGKGR